MARGSVSRVLSPPGSGTVCSDALAAIGAPPGQEWPGASPFRGNLHLGPGIRSAAIDACRCLHLGAVMRRQPYVSTTLTAAARTPTPPRCLPRQPLRPTRGPECSGISFMFSLPAAARRAARAGRPGGSPCSVRRGRTRWGRTARAARRRASAQSPRAVRPAIRSARPTRVARATQPVRRQRQARPDVGQLSDMLGVTRPHSGYPPDRVHIFTGKEYISKKCPRGDLNHQAGDSSPERGNLPRRVQVPRPHYRAMVGSCQA